VITSPFGARAWELLALLARLEELLFNSSVLAPQFALADDAHNYSPQI
jgi:hypothetical protein